MEYKLKLSEKHLRKLRFAIDDVIRVISADRSFRSLEEIEAAKEKEFVLTLVETTPAETTPVEAATAKEGKAGKGKKVEVHEG